MLIRPLALPFQSMLALSAIQPAGQGFVIPTARLLLPMGIVVSTWTIPRGNVARDTHRTIIVNCGVAPSHVDGAL